MGKRKAARHLTDKVIDSLQNYFGKAVRQHSGDVTETSRAIWASGCHWASSEEKPLHQFYPEGEDSWCGYQRMKAGNRGIGSVSGLARPEMGTSKGGGSPRKK